VRQRPVEVILARQWASSLDLPVFIVDPDGALLFYNEAAERILGFRFEETGEMRAAEWSKVFTPIDRDGEPMDPVSLPLVQAIGTRLPVHGEFGIRGLDGQTHWIATTAFPLVAQGQGYAGAMAIFWEA
jgi:PAS domain-containing protein